MTNELQAREKMEIAGQAEQTRPYQVFVPPVDILESEDCLTVLADMPGIDKDGLSIDLEENLLTIRGTNTGSAEKGRSVLHREYRDGDYFRRFTISNVIDQNKIGATLKDGVLTLVLPKAEKAKPRRIEIKAG
ncbi:MAG: Hsp20/alpha crystallin family protein [Pseudomonadota bacterium]